jgi:tRNA threonylcarbamoyladenosine biosynthesis protein TsaB
MSTHVLRVLILETSGRAGQVAVADGGRVLAERRLSETRRHGRDLAPAVAELLAERGWPPRTIGAVVVGRGPGSYTGLRVGVMSAKAFAFATGARLFAVDTFAAITDQAPPDAEQIDVIADAQQRQLYVQRFERAGAEWRAVTELAVRPADEWLTAPAASVSGPGLVLVQDRLPTGCRAVDAADREPRPASLLRLALARSDLDRGDDPWALEPLYARPSSAEQNWKK